MKKRVYISFKEAFERADKPFHGFYEDRCNQEWESSKYEDFTKAGVYFEEYIPVLFNRNRRVDRTPYIEK